MGITAKWPPFKPGNQPMDNINNHQRFSEKKSEEVSDIIEKMPTSFGRYITLIACFLVVGILALGWIIKFPDVVTGEITITGREAPVKLVTTTHGNILLLDRKDTAKVVSGEAVAIISNTATYQDVLYLKKLVSRNDILHNAQQLEDSLPDGLSVGELSNKYYLLLNTLTQYITYYRQLPYDKQKNVSEDLLRVRNEILEQNQRDAELMKKKYDVAASLYHRDSLLFARKIIPASELEQTLLHKLSVEQEYRNMKKEVIASNHMSTDAVGKLQMISSEKIEKERGFRIALYNAFFGLRESIDEWAGQELFSVVPE
jgi:hypothetical protein